MLLNVSVSAKGIALRNRLGALDVAEWLLPSDGDVTAAHALERILAMIAQRNDCVRCLVSQCE